MKLPFDQNLSHRLVGRLADPFPGSTQARLLGLDRASDVELWDHAAQDGHAIVSRDVDLAEMAALRGPPLAIWLRGGNSSTAAVEAALLRHRREIGVAATEGWWRPELATRCSLERPTGGPRG